MGWKERAFDTMSFGSEKQEDAEGKTEEGGEGGEYERDERGEGGMEGSTAPPSSLTAASSASCHGACGAPMPPPVTHFLVATAPPVGKPWDTADIRCSSLHPWYER